MMRERTRSILGGKSNLAPPIAKPKGSHCNNLGYASTPGSKMLTNRCSAIRRRFDIRVEEERSALGHGDGAMQRLDGMNATLVTRRDNTTTDHELKCLVDRQVDLDCLASTDADCEACGRHGSTGYEYGVNGIVNFIFDGQ